MNKKEPVKVCILGVGLNAYWPQFEGLEDRLIDCQAKIKDKIEAFGDVEVIDCGLIDDIDKARAANSQIKREEVELLFVYISTYALSSIMLQIVKRLNIPVILLNLMPAAAIDYQKINTMQDRGRMTGEWLANCQACSVPEFASIFNRSGTQYDIVTGHLQDPQIFDQLREWVDAARLNYSMNNNRMGVLGNYYGGMVDVYSDLKLQSVVFGTHIEVLEMCELMELHKGVTDAQMEAKLEELAEAFEIVPQCSKYELDRVAKTSVALDKLVENNRLGSLVYYYEGMPGNDYQNIITSAIAGCTLLTGKGVPAAGEYEVKAAQAMKILSLLGSGGSFSEFYALDFNDDVVLLGHDGPANPLLGEGCVKLVPLPLYHGKPGKGLSIQMSVRQGPVTLLSVVEDRDGISLLIAEGESVEGPILQTGNVNSRYKFNLPAKDFIDKWSKAGPSHHCAIGVGHVSSVLKKYAFIAKIPVNIIV